MSSLHPIRKRTALLPTRKQHILPQLRLLAPKPKTLPVQHKLELDNNNNRERQDTDREATTANVKVQHLTLQSSAPGPSVSPSYDTTPSQLLSPDSTVSCLEEKQYAVVVSSTDIYSNRVPLISVDDCFPEFTLGNKLSGVVTHGVSTHNLPYSNLQLQETIQNQYCIPIPDTAEVWTSMAQPTIDVYQDQSSQYTIDQHLPISTQQLLAAQPAYYTPLPQVSQNVFCTHCPSIWCFHLESIMFSDPEDKGISNLKRSYRDLRQHIHEAHQWHYGAGCTLCENPFCYHLVKMILLEVAKGDLSDAKIDLQSSFTTLRDHIKDAHAGC